MLMAQACEKDLRTIGMIELSIGERVRFNQNAVGLLNGKVGIITKKLSDWYDVDVEGERWIISTNSSGHHFERIYENPVGVELLKEAKL